MEILLPSNSTNLLNLEQDYDNKALVAYPDKSY